MTIGKDNFAGGETRRERVPAGEAAAMARLSGYDPSDGSLQPEGLVADLTTGEPLGDVAEQTPFAFQADGETEVLARDAEGYVHRFCDGAWGAAEGEAMAGPAESVPIRLGKQVILLTTGNRPGLMVFEPGSPGTKTRPLSLRSPDDYVSGTKPTVTASDFPGVKLFDCETGTAWGSPGTGCTINNDLTDAVSVTMGSTSTAEQACMKKNLGSGVEASNAKYLVLDVMVENDPQAHAESGSRFINLNTFGGLWLTTQGPPKTWEYGVLLTARAKFWEARQRWLQQQLTADAAGVTALSPSGYELVLYSEPDCPADKVIKRLSLPAILPLGQVTRLVFHLGTLSATTLKSIALVTSDCYTPPPAGRTWVATLYSGAFEAEWEFTGNYLLPAAAWEKSPWTFYLPPDGTGGTAVVVLQQFSPSLTDFLPPPPKVRYCYCLAGRDVLGELDYAFMVSNPSDPSELATADPWHTYTVEIALPDDGAHTPVSEYGDYVTHALVYRQRYDGTTDTYGIWEFVQAVPLASEMSYHDEGEDADAIVEGVTVPYELEVANDFASSARYVARSQGRVWAAGLDWDEEEGRWRRPTAIMVSSEGKPWAFPTTVEEGTSLVTDGTELDGYAQTGSEVRGLLARNDLVLVFLDNEFFVVRGNTPLGSGYQFVRADAVGCISARTLADARAMVIWHSGAHFYAYAGGLAQPVSRGRIDASKIAWDQPHNAVFWQEKYLFFCHFDGAPTVITYDLATGGWRTRSSAAYDFAGICTSGDGDAVYGVTREGRCVSLYGGSEDAGAAAPVREVHTQYWPVSAPGRDVQVARACLEVVTDSANGETLSLTLRAQGRSCGAAERTLVVTKHRTYYEVPVNLHADAIKLELSYTGTNPPVIQFLGFAPDPAAA